MLFISDKGRCDVQMMNIQSGKFHKKYGGKGVLFDPQGVCVVNETELWVADSGKSRVLVFDLAMTERLWTIENTFRVPMCICVCGKEIFITDSHNRRIQVFTERGKFVRTLLGLARMGSLNGIVIHERELYVTHNSNINIVVIDLLTGQILRTFGPSYR